MADQSSPISVHAPGIFTQVTAGLNSGYGLRQDGRVFAWGDNSGGQLGDNSLTQRNTPVIVAGAHQFDYIAAGWNHVLGLAKNGSAWAWGSSEFGQLGTGSVSISASSPESVVGDHEFIKVDAGECHSIGLKADGTIWTWGCNDASQLGIPPAIGAVGAGLNLVAAMDTDGRLWMWGDGSHGEIGDGTTNSRSTPRLVAGSATWLSTIYPPQEYLSEYLCTGSPLGLCTGLGNMENWSSWAIRDEGNGEQSTWTWGRGDNGQLGTGAFLVSSSSPVSVLGSRNWGYWQCTAANDHMCCIDKFWKTWCWGYSALGQTGLNYPGSPASWNSPVQLHSAMENNSGFPPPDFVLATIKVVEAGNGFTLFIDTVGRAWGTGQNTFGKLMVGDTTLRNSPVRCVSPPGALGWMDCAAGDGNSFWIDVTGNVWTAGSTNGLTGCGAGGCAADGSPHIVYGSPHQAVKIQTAWDDFIVTGFLRADGSLWMWGHNNYGQLGIGNVTNQVSPSSVLGSGNIYNFVDFSISALGVVAIDDTGQVWAWGHESVNGQGDGLRRSSPEAISALSDLIEPNRSVPTQVIANTLFSDIAAGDNHTLAMDADDNVWAWGDNTSGQLGQGDLVDRSTPTLVTGLSTNIIDIAAGTQYSYALDDAEDLWAWGDNTCGKLGFAEFPNWVAVGAGSQGYGFAIDGNTGRLWSWGVNTSGQLGIGNTSNRSSPVSVFDPDPTVEWGVHPDAYELATGPCDVPGGCTGTGDLSDNTAWAVKKDGSAWMWGNSTYGNIGDGSFGTANRLTPKSVLGFGPVGLSDIIHIVSTPGGPASTYALDTRGRLWVWGYTGYILGGTGSPASVNSPIDVREAILNARGVTDPFVVGGTFRYLNAGLFGGMAGSGSKVWVWGDNSNCRLCKGDCTGVSSPVELSGYWAYAAHGGDHSYLMDLNGNIFGCGYNESVNAMVLPWAFAGGPVNRSTPTALLGSPHSAILVRVPNDDAGGGFLRADGSLWMWGDNSNGQCGVGHTTHLSSPTSVLGSGVSYSFVDFRCGGESGTVALDSEGRVWGWGQWGHVGDNTTTQRTTPTRTSVPGPTALPGYTTTPVQVYRPW